MIRLQGLTVRARNRVLVDDISVEVAPGECVALIGPSGAGKSLTARSILGLLPEGITAVAQEFTVDGEPVVQPASRVSEGATRHLRGQVISFIPQEAQSALDPLRRVGDEVAEPLRIHGLASRGEARDRAVAALAEVGLDEPALRARQYPEQISGGQRQRAVLASAQIAAPGYLVADEPTTALDPMLRADLIAALRARVEAGLGVLLISHDLATAARIADRVIVLADGRVVETGPIRTVLEAPQHPVTRALAAAATGEPLTGSRNESAPVVLEARDLTLHRTMPDGTTRATVSDVSLAVRAGSTLGIVGASGAGKSSVARLLLALETPTRGEVELAGEPWSRLAERERRGQRHRIQAIAQDPLAVLNPRWTAARSIAEGLPAMPRVQRAAAVDALLTRVGLDASLGQRRPGALSGGQRQRVAIARALAASPQVLIADEPIAALDPPAQDAILRLLAELRDRDGLALVMISHDIAALRRIADDLLVLDQGRVVAAGPAEAVVAAADPVTRALLQVAH